MKKLEEVLENNISGLYYGNRILLPFKADILKAVVENHIIMDFSTSKRKAEYFKREDLTEIYFYGYDDLSECVTKYETVKLVVVEEGDDIFDIENHKRLLLHVKEKHVLQIEEADDNTLFIE